ncbi:jg14064 [Pararge aegeria aegeria]|uniref:Jg14064 protein n=1 Tax=Pararge aegeria aegeria TaxID=348720 RepID=A0A8S4SPE9_9NEOP|nr:jg14064 [Pararge aegeria aegeria]
MAVVIEVAMAEPVGVEVLVGIAAGVALGVAVGVGVGEAVGVGLGVGVGMAMGLPVYVGELVIKLVLKRGYHSKHRVGLVFSLFKYRSRGLGFDTSGVQSSGVNTGYALGMH